MGANSYVAAIEIGSSKITGCVGVKTYDGVKIVAYASEPVNGFISRGVVRNVDETSNCLTSIVNRMEAQLDKITIEKAYVAFGGLSMRSVKSAVVRDFNEYTKITQGIIDEIALENDSCFNVPDAYQKISVIAQESKLNGDISFSPIGIPTRRIECRFLNIIVKEQYMKQLDESFNMANIKIADSFNSARIEADILLSEDDRRAGCAFVNIGSETTTISVYSNGFLRQLSVLPLGSENITKDLCYENISHQEAEQLKIFKGYASSSSDNSAIPTEIVDLIIAARTTEILQNVKYQLEHSKEMIGSVVFTGGGAKLKNIEKLIEENLPGYKMRIITDFSANYQSEESLYLMKGAITPVLYGLLKMGGENCCKEEEPVVQPAQDSLFTAAEMNASVAETMQQQKQTGKTTKEEGGNNATKTSSKSKEAIGGVTNLFWEFIKNVTRDEDDGDNNKEE